MRHLVLNISLKTVNQIADISRCFFKDFGVLGLCSSFLKHYIVPSSGTEHGSDEETAEEKAQREKTIGVALNETKVVSA